MKDNKTKKTKTILFYILMALFLAWLILSLTSIKTYTEITQSAPWYTGIEIYTLIFFVPIVSTLVIYLLIDYNLKKEGKK